MNHSHLFFFQAEDGIRDTSVTGVQTCALPIYIVYFRFRLLHEVADIDDVVVLQAVGRTHRQFELVDLLEERRVEREIEIGRASCRERVEISGVGVLFEKKIIEWSWKGMVIVLV